MKLGNLATALLCFAAACATPPASPTLIGAVETVRVVEADLAFRARIDTGAAASSIHATGIRVEGARVHFTLENASGERRDLSAALADVARVRSVKGTEVRPRVALELELGGVAKRVRVSLRDRSRMDYKLLVGRDFLAGDFVVDVDR